MFVEALEPGVGEAVLLVVEEVMEGLRRAVVCTDVEMSKRK